MIQGVTMRKWSKLQKALYNIVDSDMNFQIQCSVFKTNTSWYGKGRAYVPRFWITIDKNIVWDFPNMFLNSESLREKQSVSNGFFAIREVYGASDNYTWVSDVIRKYINTPKERLLAIEFENDKYGLANILKAVDRRIGMEKRKNYIENLYKNEYIR